MNITDLEELIREVCPIEGINSDGVIFYTESANEKQRGDADKIMKKNLKSLEV